MKNTLIIEQTRKWLKTVVIDYSLCPFAQLEFERNSIRYAVLSSQDEHDCLAMLRLECEHLENAPDCETTLIILAQGFSDFEQFLALIHLAEQHLWHEGFEGIFQLASFHPDYRFANAPNNDPANYTNRSPHPMLHILREASIEKALNTHPDPENIPERNIKLTRELGINALQNLLANCLNHP